MRTRTGIGFVFIGPMRHVHSSAFVNVFSVPEATGCQPLASGARVTLPITLCSLSRIEPHPWQAAAQHAVQPRRAQNATPGSHGAEPLHTPVRPAPCDRTCRRGTHCQIDTGKRSKCQFHRCNGHPLIRSCSLAAYGDVGELPQSRRRVGLPSGNQVRRDSKRLPRVLEAGPQLVYANRQSVLGRPSSHV
jgi:hypothetical protein